MQALAEAIGAVVGGTILFFLLPPLIGFLTWAWTSWMKLWTRVFFGKIEQEFKPYERDDHISRLR